MTGKQRILAALCILSAWILTLGIHSSYYVRAYCRDHKQFGQPEVYVSMEPVYDSGGVPLIHTYYEDALPYPLDLAVTVDDRISGDGVVIESLEVTFENGQTDMIVRPDRPRGGPFSKFEPVEKVPGRTFRHAIIGIPNAIWKRGSFQMRIKGYITGADKQTFERRIRMDYSRDSDWHTGWFHHVILPRL